MSKRSRDRGGPDAPTAPMTEQDKPLDVEAIEAEHVREAEPVSQFNPALFWCAECDHQWPCPTLALIAEVRRLREEVAMLEKAYWGPWDEQPHEDAGKSIFTHRKREPGR